MLSLSKNYNSNYLAKVIKIDKIKKHPNADSLQLVTVDFQNIISDMTAKEGDYYVYFPVESQINTEFLSSTNSFSSPLLNKDTTVKGFFGKNGRVRAVNLRGEYSLGYITPLKTVEEFIGKKIDELDKEFDTIDGVLMVQKYFVKKKEPRTIKDGKKPRISRLVEGQVHLHVSTDNLRKEIYKIHPQDRISISYKLHGCSGWTSNIIVNKKLSIVSKVIRLLGVNVTNTEYDIVYGSRKVVKNEYETQGVNHFYGEDVWGKATEKIKDMIPKGFTLYYELVGYTSGGADIQKGYDYGCPMGSNEIYVYRITFTNQDGVVSDLSTEQIIELCERMGIKTVPYFFIGKATDFLEYPQYSDIDSWRSELLKELEQDFTEKDCYMCTNNVPEEGIVLRVDKLLGFEAYKLKSNKYLEYETKLMDEEVSDLESEN